jgi:hypothetical protein
MTANAGYHAYATGDVLTAAQVQYNLQNQTVMYFATTSARTTAIGSVTVEGMVTYIPANGLEYYNGTAWTGVSNPGDITDVLAGKGLTGGGTSGSVTLALGTTAKGDLVAGTGTTTAAALTVGADGSTLVADSSTSTGLRYTAGNPISNPTLNSAMQIWQRSTSTAGSTTAFCADRWAAYRTVAGSTFSRQVTGDTTNLPNIQYAIRVSRDSGNASAATLILAQTFETVNSIPFAGKIVTLSFYARAGANLTANLGVQLGSGTGTDQNWTGFSGLAYVVNTTQALTSTWTRYTFTGTVPTTSTQLNMQFYYVPTGTAGANDYYEITGVQIDIGSVALPFRTYAGTVQGELAACQRYYYRTGTNDSAAYGILTGTGWADTTTHTIAVLPLPVTMRVAPTAVDYPTISTLRTYGYGGAQALTALTMGSQTSANFVYLDGTNTSTITAGAVQYLQKNNSATAYIGVTAEL